MTDTRDTLFADPATDRGMFAFDADVASVFPDMIKRSVPGYLTIISMTGLLAGEYALADSNLYDLGCSLGASTLAMRQNIRQRGCRIIAVDNSHDMLQRCRNLVEEDPHDTPVELHCANLQDIPVANASVVILNFTLQFVPPEQRDRVINRIYAGMQPGGIMVLSEKLSFSDQRLDALMVELHHRFKRANGYSELEVAAKRTALETVLVPETLEQHRQRLGSAGFSSCDVWFQCFNFASLVALK